MSLALFQASVFIQTLYAGLIVGVLFDISRCVRAAFCSKAVRICADVLFYIAFFAVAALTLYHMTGLILRAYVFLGIGAGAALYLLGISRIIRLIVKKMRANCQKRKDTLAQRRG